MILSDKYDMINSIKASIARKLTELNAASEEKFEIDMTLAEFPVILEEGMDIAGKLREAGETLSNALKPDSGLVWK